ncbi:unnamed protein product, partial [Phaeothamnion confervicola]
PTEASNFADAKHHVDAYLGDDSELQIAEEQLTQILSRNPSYAPAYVELARIEIKRSLLVNFDHEAVALESAESMLKKAEILDPTYADSHVVASYLYTLKRDFVKSDEHYNRAKKLNSPSPWMELNNALSFYRQGRLAEAQRIYESYVTYFSSNQ